MFREYIKRFPFVFEKYEECFVGASFNRVEGIQSYEYADPNSFYEKISFSRSETDDWYVDVHLIILENRDFVRGQYILLGTMAEMLEDDLQQTEEKVIWKLPNEVLELYTEGQQSDNEMVKIRLNHVSEDAISVILDRFVALCYKKG